MEPILQPLYEVFRLNTDLLRNCCQDLTEKHVNERLGPKTNSIAFIVAHIVDARHFLAKSLGSVSVTHNPVGAMLANINSIDEVESMVELDTLRAEWDRISQHADTSFEAVNAKQLAARASMPVPTDDDSVCGLVAFLLQHESYHIGQIALIRKQLGYPAMSYDRGRA